MYLAETTHSAFNGKRLKSIVFFIREYLCRWKKALKPGITKGHWGAAEDQRLREAVLRGKECGVRNWGDIAGKSAT